MRVTTFSLEHDGVVVAVRAELDWQTIEAVDGQALARVDFAELHSTHESVIRLARIRAGGSFPMHTGPELAVCQIIAGRGKLGLPGARSLDFAAPELYILEPGTLHDWHDIVEDTVMSVCLITVTTS